MTSRLIPVCSIGSVLLFGGSAATVALGQTISMDIVIDHHVPPGEPLEKAVDYFTSRDLPERRRRQWARRSVPVSVQERQLQGPWKRSVITAHGGAYERARPI